MNRNKKIPAHKCKPGWEILVFQKTFISNYSARKVKRLKAVTVQSASADFK